MAGPLQSHRSTSSMTQRQRIAGVRTSSLTVDVGRWQVDAVSVGDIRTSRPAPTPGRIDSPCAPSRNCQRKLDQVEAVAVREARASRAHPQQLITPLSSRQPPSRPQKYGAACGAAPSPRLPSDTTAPHVEYVHRPSIPAHARLPEELLPYLTEHKVRARCRDRARPRRRGPAPSRDPARQPGDHRRAAG